MPWKNSAYKGPDIMVTLMRATNVPWQQRSIRNGYLISNAQYKEQFKPSDRSWLSLYAPVEADTRRFITRPISTGDYERTLRNLHSDSSSKVGHPYEAPNSKYVSMTSSAADTSWGQGTNPTLIFRFEIWRSDVWKGKHDLTRDPFLYLWLAANILTRPSHQQAELLSSQTPPDWDKGAEFEWLALGGTRVYNVHESSDGARWTASVGKADIDFWWEAV